MARNRRRNGARSVAARQRRRTVIESRALSRHRSRGSPPCPSVPCGAQLLAPDPLSSLGIDFNANPGRDGWPRQSPMKSPGDRFGRRSSFRVPARAERNRPQTFFACVLGDDYSSYLPQMTPIVETCRLTTQEGSDRKRRPSPADPALLSRREKTSAAVGFPTPGISWTGQCRNLRLRT
jgi:hypothetical protein